MIFPYRGLYKLPLFIKVSSFVYKYLILRSWANPFWLDKQDRKNDNVTPEFWARSFLEQLIEKYDILESQQYIKVIKHELLFLAVTLTL